MSQQMTEAMKSAKTIQTEMVQWENRLESVKNEVENFRRQAEILQGEIDAKRTEYSGYIADREKQMRNGFEKNAEDKRVLDAQRDEFKASLDNHLKEKSMLAHERSEFDKEKAKILGQKQMVDGFIQAVRRAYSLIAE